MLCITMQASRITRSTVLNEFFSYGLWYLAISLPSSDGYLILYDAMITSGGYQSSQSNVPEFNPIKQHKLGPTRINSIEKMVYELINLKPLILAGGRATRMGEPKHMMQTPDGSSLLQRTFDLMSDVFQQTSTVYVSIAQDSVLGSFMTDNMASARLIFDEEENTTVRSAGPASGLLSAYHMDPTAIWLVVGCDYPLLTTHALDCLRQAYEPPITCFQNSDGFFEPLVGIWSPPALHALEDEVVTGKGSLTAAIKRCDGNTVSAPDGCEHWLFNVNNQEEWHRALELLKA